MNTKEDLLSAILRKDLVSFTRLCQEGCPYNASIERKVAKSLDLLEIWIKYNPLSDNMLLESNSNGDNQIVEYLLDNKCPIWPHASVNGALSLPNIVRLCNSGYVTPIFTMYEAIKYNKIEVVDYLHKNECPWDKEAFTLSLSTTLEKVVYLYENGCPHEEYNYSMFTDIEEYLHKKKILRGPICSLCRCEHCLYEKLEELWHMESEIYDNVLQWLPKELLDDII